MFAENFLMSHDQRVIKMADGHVGESHDTYCMRQEIGDFRMAKHGCVMEDVGLWSIGQLNH